jgi:hypothetical protein
MRRDGQRQKKQGNIGNKGAYRELGTRNKVPTWGTRSKVDPKNPKAKILNEDLSSRTNPRVKFEKNFRRAAFGLQKTARSTMRKTIATTKSEESVKSTVTAQSSEVVKTLDRRGGIRINSTLACSG